MGQFDIVNQGACGRQFGNFKAAKGVECLDLIQLFQAQLRVFGIKARRRLRGDDVFIFGIKVKNVGAVEQPVGKQDFTGIKPRKCGGQSAHIGRLNVKITGRHIKPRQANLAAQLGHRSQIVVSARIKQAVFGEGARRDQTDDTAFDHGFGPAFFGLGRVFHLFADGDTESFADQTLKICFVTMDGNTGHGNFVTLMLAAFCQGNIKGFGGFDRIVKEQLVKIAHPIKQQAVLILFLDFKELDHHRGRTLQRKGWCDGCGIGCVSDIVHDGFDSKP